MKRSLKCLLTAAIFGALGSLVYIKTRPEPVSVVIKSVTKGTVERTVSNTKSGTIKACRRARLSPSIGGQIDKLPIHKGDAVKEGQLLLEIWNRDLNAQLMLAESNVVNASAQAKAVCLKAEAAEREAVRIKNLFKQGVASEEQTDKAVSQAASLRADCEGVAAAVLVAKANFELSKANLERTRLIAPFDGVIAEINGELKEFVTPSPLGIATLPTIDIIENDCFYVTAPIDEVDVSDIVIGMQARITMDAFHDRKFEGRVRRISDYVLELEKQARTVDVEVDFAETEKNITLLAGYSADVEIVISVREGILRVPTEAVMDGRKVFVFHTDTGLIEERSVTVGISNWMYTEILSGVKEAELVVINAENPGIKGNALGVLSEESS